MIPECILNEKCQYGNYIIGLTSKYLMITVKDETLITNSENQQELRRGYANFWVTCHACTVNSLNQQEVKYPKIPTFTTSKIGKLKGNLNIHEAVFYGAAFSMSEATNQFYPSNFCAIPGFVLTASEQYLNSAGVPVNTNFPINCGI